MTYGINYAAWGGGVITETSGEEARVGIDT